MGLTADEVRDKRFSKARLGRRGYSEVEVIGFLAEVANTLDGRGNVTAAQVHNVAFSTSLGVGGFDEEEVDDYLDLIEEELAVRAEAG
ncbi:DivIVA domain-containing protein [Allokutzneria albata]|uniref:Cell wall synthesis protein Wag31 n=1 Tax=Allokutzneria albata TaxID=211114 RepID=A0A1G9ZL60_ALLAB|nr:DivIVA domain-containing protein [Allokutzneria albata]SDN21815.1 DivIVA domain-containing protein [Allokutzneria albata]